MKPSTTSSDGQAFLPLGQIEYEIFARRTRCGLPVFRDPAAFSEQLKTLAKWHAGQAKPLKDEERKKRYQAVAKAVHLLQEALMGLKPDEIEWLLSEENRYLSSGTPDAAANEPDVEQLWAELNIESTRSHERVLIQHNLHTLQMVADGLASNKRKEADHHLPSSLIPRWSSFGSATSLVGRLALQIAGERENGGTKSWSPTRYVAWPQSFTKREKTQ